VTSVADLTPTEIVQRYKSLADIVRGFRVLESEIEIGPIHHRLPDRIRAHATICFMALILYRVMRSRLRAGGTPHSPERALSKLRRVQHHRITLNDSQPVAGLSTIDQEQASILAALTIKKPTIDTQLTLLYWSDCLAPLYGSMTYAFNCRTRGACRWTKTLPLCSACLNVMRRCPPR
jgi:hypothetical protein